jgi:hypothetical protein
MIVLLGIMICSFIFLAWSFHTAPMYDEETGLFYRNKKG